LSGGAFQSKKRGALSDASANQFAMLTCIGDGPRDAHASGTP